MKTKTKIVAASTVRAGERLNTTTGMRTVVKVEVRPEYTSITVEDPASKGGQSILSFGPTGTVLVEKAAKK